MTTERDRFGNVFAPGLEHLGGAPDRHDAMLFNPIEATAVPPGTSSLLVKFVPPETLERFGGAEALAKAVDSSVDRLAALLREPGALRVLLLGEG